MLSPVLRNKVTKQAAVCGRDQVTLGSPPGRPHSRLLPVSRPIQQRQAAEAQEVPGGPRRVPAPVRPAATLGFEFRLVRHRSSTGFRLETGRPDAAASSPGHLRVLARGFRSVTGVRSPAPSPGPAGCASVAFISPSALIAQPTSAETCRAFCIPRDYVQSRPSSSSAPNPRGFCPL